MEAEHITENGNYSDDEEEEEGDIRYIETDFQFTDFIKRLSHPKIVRTCGLALKKFETNSVYTNQCIIKLLHRIAFDSKMYVMLFQLSIFRTFQKIFALKDLPQHKELVRFATYIMRQFFKVAETNNKVFIEALFWKSKKEACEVEAGYGSYNEKSTAAAKVWSEEEEDELRRLFMEHQNAKLEEDVVDWIVDNLIDSKKSRIMVLKKLKELCLLNVKYKPKKPGVRSRPPQNWGAEEEEQLQELWEEFKDAHDPLGCIMSRLEINRPKNRVIEKMLVMGLIQDKKELRKKRTKSTRTTGSGRGRRRESVGSSASDSDSDQFNTPIQPSGSSRAQKKAVAHNKRPSKKKRIVAPQASKSELIKMILANTASGRQEALEWLKDSFSDAIEDFGDGSDESVPLVPIMDYAQLAMEEEEFRAMLKGFGVCEPFDEQEMYWRIPSHLTVEELKVHCELIQQALDDTLVLPEIGVTGDAPHIENNADESSDEDYLDALRKNRTHSHIAPNGGSTASMNADTMHEVNETEASSSSKKGRSMITSDSEEDADRNDQLVLPSTRHKTETNPEDTIPETANFIQKRRNMIASDSDDETEEQAKESDRKRSRSGSDTEKQSSKKSRIIDSDDE